MFLLAAAAVASSALRRRDRRRRRSPFRRPRRVRIVSGVRLKLDRRPTPTRRPRTTRKVTPTDGETSPRASSNSNRAQPASAPSVIVSSSPPGGTLTSALLKLALAPGASELRGRRDRPAVDDLAGLGLELRLERRHRLLLAGRVDHPPGDGQQLIATFEPLAVHVRRDQRQRAGAQHRQARAVP